MSYTLGMSNVTPIRTVDPVRRNRAEFVKQAIENDDRSIRYIAGRIALNHSSLADRLKGKVAFTAEDIEGIAHVLKRDPVDFYRAYLAAKDGPNGDPVMESQTTD